MAFEETGYKNEDEQEDSMQQLSSGSGSFQQSGAEKRKPVKDAGSGMFTNIQDYMKSPESGKKMAEKIGSGFQNKATNIQSQADEKLKAFNEQYNPEQQRLESAQDRVGQYIQEAGTKSQEELLRRANEIKGLSSGQYTDPNDVDFTQQQKDQQELQKKALGILSEGGTRQALQETYNRPDYTSGMRDLDYLVARQQPAQQILQQRSEQAVGGLKDYDLAAKQQDAQQRDLALRNLAQSYQAGGERDVIGNIRSAEEDLYGTIEQRRLAEMRDRNTQLNAWKQRASAAAKYGPSDEIKADPVALAEFYANQSSGNLDIARPNYYGVDANKFIGDTSELTAAQVAQQAEVDRFRALAGLAGTPEAARIAQAGSYKPIFDEAGFQAAQRSAQSSIEAAAQAEMARRAEAARKAEADRLAEIERQKYKNRGSQQDRPDSTGGSSGSTGASSDTSGRSEAGEYGGQW